MNYTIADVIQNGFVNNVHNTGTDQISMVDVTLKTCFIQYLTKNQPSFVYEPTQTTTKPCTNARANARACVRTHTYTHTRTHTYTHRRTDTHTHTHTLRGSGKERERERETDWRSPRRV